MRDRKPINHGLGECAMRDLGKGQEFEIENFHTLPTTHNMVWIRSELSQFVKKKFLQFGSLIAQQVELIS